jgi:hypothetical protein
MEHKRRKVEAQCIAGSQFVYFCDDCHLHLFGHYNENDLENLTGWTWELTRNGEEIATAGNKHARSYGGTEEAADEDGLKRFDEEPCSRPN